MAILVINKPVKVIFGWVRMKGGQLIKENLIKVSRVFERRLKGVPRDL